MGRRDYELEAATAAVGGHLSEPVVRALIVGAPGSQEGTLGGALKSLFGRSRRKSGLRHQNVLVLTPTSIRLLTCTGGCAWPPRVDEEVGCLAGERREGVCGGGREVVRVLGDTQRLADEPLLRRHAHCSRRRGTRRRAVPRTDSARATIEALEDATGSPPSKITARRRKKQQREAEGAEGAEPAD